MKSRTVISGKGPCAALHTIVSEDCLLVQYDSHLHFLRISDLEPLFSPIRNTVAYCLDRNVTSPIELAVASRKAIGIYQMDSKLHLSRTINTQDVVATMCKDSRIICFADSSVYNLLNSKKETVIPLFPYDSSTMKPLVLSIEKNEFLLVTGSAQGFGIGVFINAKGEPIRGTLQWPSIPIDIAFHDPYIISLLQNSTIQIHNYENQILIQSISIPSANPPKFLKTVSFPVDLMTSDESKSFGMIQLIFATTSDLFGLVMKPWDLQLTELFDLNQIEQALLLLAKLCENEESLEQTERRAIYYLRAALAFFEKCDFDKAFLYFKRSNSSPLLVLLVFSKIDPHSVPNQELNQDILNRTISLEEASMVYCIYSSKSTSGID